jgi:hypothetical protein
MILQTSIGRFSTIEPRNMLKPIMMYIRNIGIQLISIKDVSTYSKIHLSRHKESLRSFLD